MSNDRTDTLFIRLDPELATRLKMRVAENGKTINRYMTRLIFEHMHGWRSAYHIDNLRGDI